MAVRNVQKLKEHVQSVQMYCFSFLNMQIYDVLVAVFVVVAFSSSLVIVEFLLTPLL